MNLKALRAGSHCVGDELCRGGDTAAGGCETCATPAAGGESCRTGFFYFRKKEKHMDTIAAYLIFLNLVGFLIMGEDKRRAKMHRWRISERMLFLVSILGGSIGTWAGMYVFHHKTRHWYFVIGIPLILILQIAGAIWLYRQGLYHL